LADAGGDVRATDGDGQNAAHKAAQGGSRECLRLLLALEPQLATVKDFKGKVPEDYLK